MFSINCGIYLDKIIYSRRAIKFIAMFSRIYTMILLCDSKDDEREKAGVGVLCEIYCFWHNGATELAASLCVREAEGGRQRVE